VRNGILVTFKGEETNVETVVDWYRRDDEGRPMPAEWRELMGQVRLPWSAKPQPVSDGLEAVSASEATAAEA
jgi:hypothetical protein